MLTFLNDFHAALSQISHDFVPYKSRRFTPNKLECQRTLERWSKRLHSSERSQRASNEATGRRLPRFREIAFRAPRALDDWRPLLRSQKTARVARAACTPRQALAEQRRRAR